MVLFITFTSLRWRFNNNLLTTSLSLSLSTIPSWASSMHLLESVTVAGCSYWLYWLQIARSPMEVAHSRRPTGTMQISVYQASVEYQTERLPRGD